MTSSENIVALYMAVVEKEPAEEAANIAELSRRILSTEVPNKANRGYRDSSPAVEVA